MQSTDATRKAEVLIEALGYFRRFRGSLIVIKLGGSAMEDAEALRATLQDVVFLETAGLRPVLVHGGGKAIDRAMAEAGLQPKKVRGRRITDEATLSIVVRVLREEICGGIVRQIRDFGGRAVGLHGGSQQALFGEKLLLETEEGPVDLGQVGRVTRIDRKVIEDFALGGVVPVIPSVALDANGKWLNINADTAAAAVALALGAEKLVFLSDTPGILMDKSNASTLIPTLDAKGCLDLMRRKIIDEGMIPKVEACLDALRGGVRKVHLVDGRSRHALMLEIFTDKGTGTEIVLGS